MLLRASLLHTISRSAVIRAAAFKGGADCGGTTLGSRSMTPNSDAAADIDADMSEMQSSSRVYQSELKGPRPAVLLLLFGPLTSLLGKTLEGSEVEVDGQ